MSKQWSSRQDNVCKELQRMSKDYSSGQGNACKELQRMSKHYSSGQDIACYGETTKSELTLLQETRKCL